MPKARMRSAAFLWRSAIERSSALRFPVAVLVAGLDAGGTFAGDRGLEATCTVVAAAGARVPVPGVAALAATLVPRDRDDGPGPAGPAPSALPPTDDSLCCFFGDFGGRPGPAGLACDDACTLLIGRREKPESTPAAAIVFAGDARSSSCRTAKESSTRVRAWGTHTRFGSPWCRYTDRVG